MGPRISEGGLVPTAAMRLDEGTIDYLRALTEKNETRTGALLNVGD